MATKTRTTTLVIAAAVIAVAVLGYSALTASATAQTTTTTQLQAGSQGYGRGQGFGPGFGPGSSHGFGQGVPVGPGMQGAPAFRNEVNISVGQTFTLTSTQGRYVMVGSSGTNGTASGAVTFTVTAKLAQGYTLSISGGSVTVAGTTYTLSSGTAQMSLAASTLTGQGSTTPSGQFLLRATAHGSFVGSTGLVSLDLQSGSTEYLVSLAGNITS